MKIQELIEALREILASEGNIEIQAFHHEGGSSPRATPEEITKESFVFNYGESRVLIIGGWYK